MTRTIPAQRLAYIDLLEAIAIFFVMIYHSTLYVFDFVNNPDLLCYTRYLFRTLLSTCVPLFFFANGFLLFGKELSLGKHIRKIVRLIVLAILWGAIDLTILTIAEERSLSIKELLWGIWTWKDGYIDAMWYIGALVCIYLIFPVLKHLYDTHWRLFLYFTGVAALFTFGNVILNQGATVLGGWLGGSGATFQGVNFSNMFNPFRGGYGYSVVYFCFGGVVGTKMNEIWQIPPRQRNSAAGIALVLSCLSLFAVGICYSKLSGVVWDVVWYGYDTVFTFVNVLAIFLLCLNLNRGNQLLHMISRNTLGIYFVHVVLVRLTKPWVVQLDLSHTLVANLVYALLLLAASLGVTMLLQRIPLLKKLVQ